MVSVQGDNDRSKIATVEQVMEVIHCGPRRVESESKIKLGIRNELDQLAKVPLVIVTVNLAVPSMREHTLLYFHKLSYIRIETHHTRPASNPFILDSHR